MTEEDTLIATVVGPHADRSLFLGLEERKFPEEELRSVVPDVPGTRLTGHDQSGSVENVGEVISAEFDEEEGALVMDVEIYDEEIQERITGELVNIAPVFKHDIPKESEKTDNGARIVGNLEVESVQLHPSLIDGVPGVVETRKRTQPLSDYLE